MLVTIRKRRNILLKIIQTTSAFALSTAAAWISYSKLIVNHAMPLPDAVAAQRKHVLSPTAGRVSYYMDTSASGRPLVLIHSINAAPSAYEVRPLFEHYRQSRPVYALELPGFGFSERVNRRYSPQLYAESIRDFISQEIGEPVDVIALSLSCEFVAMAALSNPDLFNSLVFVSPTGFRASQPDVPEETLYKVFSFPLWSQPFFDLLVLRRSIRFFLGKSFVGEISDGFVEYAHATAHQPGARYAPLYFVSGQLFTSDVYEQVYTHLDRPVLVIYDRDPNVTFEKLPELLKTNPNWRAEKITPTMGLPHWEQLEQTVATLETFWGTVS